MKSTLQNNTFVKFEKWGKIRQIKQRILAISHECFQTHAILQR